MHRIIQLGSDQWRVLRQIRLEALEDTPDAFTATFDDELNLTESDWRSRLERDSSITFVAFAEKNLAVGLVVGSDYDNQAGLFSMWVNSSYRGQGIAGDLVDSVIQWARNGGYLHLFLDVADTNTSAIALYEGKGFFATGAKGALPPPRQSVTEHQRVLVLS